MKLSGCVWGKSETVFFMRWDFFEWWGDDDLHNGYLHIVPCVLIRKLDQDQRKKNNYDNKNQ